LQIIKRAKNPSQNYSLIKKLPQASSILNYFRDFIASIKQKDVGVGWGGLQKIVK